MNLLRFEDRELPRWPGRLAYAGILGTFAGVALAGIFAPSETPARLVGFALVVLGTLALAIAVGALERRLARLIKARATEQRLRAQLRAPRSLNGRSAWFHGGRP